MRSVTGAHLRDMHEPAKEELEEQRQLEVPPELCEAFRKAVKAVDRRGRPFPGGRLEKCNFKQHGSAVRVKGSRELMRVEDLHLVAWIPDQNHPRALNAYLPRGRSADTPVGILSCKWVTFSSLFCFGVLQDGSHICQASTELLVMASTS